MNKFRYEICEKAFLKIAREGFCSVQELLSRYDGSRHPDVAMGKCAAEDATADFRESFEMHHNTTHDYDTAQPVSLGEFIEFYAYHSAMTESDHVFDQLITGVWNSDRSNYEETPYAGTAQNITQINAHQKWKLDHHRKMFAGNESDILVPNSNYTGGERDWLTTHKGMHAEPVNAGFQPAGAPTWPAGSNPTWAGALMDEGQRITTLQDQYYDEERQYLADEQAEPVKEGRPAEEQPASPQTANPADEAIAKIRSKLRERGARGFIGFRRVFKIADNNGSGSLDWPEFWQVFQDYRLQVTDDDLRAAFGAFDVNGDQNVNFDEFLRHVVGEMNPTRKSLVAQAFAKLDRDGSGEVDKHDVTGVYDASNHPDVRAGKKTGEEVLTEFLDTFEIHSSL